MAALGGRRPGRRHRAGLGRHRRERRRSSRTCSSRHLPGGPALYPDDFLTDQPERFFVAELVREQVLRHTHAELPFSTAVVVDAFEEPEADGGLLRLHCTILVERTSQKPILLGKGGTMIKAIGTAARARAGALLRREGVPRPARQGARTTGATTGARCRDLGLPEGRQPHAPPPLTRAARNRV